LQALGIAAVKAVVCIVGITAGGRLLIRPLYKKIAELANAEIFAATTLLVVLGTSFMTQLAGAGITCTTLKVGCYCTVNCTICTSTACWAPAL
jgi:Kef-type K+ transport system membrane component KefB